MLCLLAVFLIFYLVSISGEVWKNASKFSNDFIIASFFLEISPMVSCLFHEKLEAGVDNRLNQVNFWIQLYTLLKSYVEITLEYTTSRFTPSQMYYAKKSHLLSSRCVNCGDVLSIQLAMISTT